MCRNWYLNSYSVFENMNRVQIILRLSNKKPRELINHRQPASSCWEIFYAKIRKQQVSSLIHDWIQTHHISHIFLKTRGALRKTSHSLHPHVHLQHSGSSKLSKRVHSRWNQRLLYVTSARWSQNCPSTHELLNNSSPETIQTKDQTYHSDEAGKKT